MELRIVYDNEAKGGLKSDWGFSCFIDAGGRKIVFDTGASGDVLAYNMQKLGLRKEEVDVIALSHEHWDHVGGLDAVLHQNVRVYIPRSFTKKIKKRIEEKAADVFEVSEPADIFSGVHTTGELGQTIKEQSLVLETRGGVVVLTGCAHPGLETIVEAAAGFGDLYGVIGGFHGFDTLKLLEGLELVMPCHCTARKKEIMQMYSEKAVWCGGGETITI